MSEKMITDVSDAISFYMAAIAQGISFDPLRGFCSKDGESFFPELISDESAQEFEAMNDKAVTLLTADNIDAWEVTTYFKIILMTHSLIKENRTALTQKGIYCATQMRYIEELLRSNQIRMGVYHDGETASDTDMRRATFFLDLLSQIHTQNLSVGQGRKQGGIHAQLIADDLMPAELQAPMKWAVKTLQGSLDTYSAPTEGVGDLFDDICDKHMRGRGADPDSAENDDDPTQGVY